MEKLPHERVCYVCQKKYSYCGNCSQYDQDKKWMYLFHDEKCLDIYNIHDKYKAGKLTKEQAKARLSKYDLTDAVKPNTEFARDLKEIMKEDTLANKSVENNENRVIRTIVQKKNEK